MAFGSLKGALTGNAVSIGTSAPINTVASGSAVVAVGDLVYAVFGEQTAPTMTTVSDNLGNTYTATQIATDAGTSTARAYWSRVTVAGTITAITAVANGGTNNFAGAALIIEGPFAASPLDKNPTNTTADVTSPFTCPTTGTLTQAQEVVIGWVVSTGNAVWAATSPNLLGAQIATAAILSVRIGYQAVSATTAVAPEFTGTNPTDDVLGTTSFMRDLTPPFTQDSWPLPQVVTTLRQNVIQSTLALTTPAPTPFSQDSWPLPVPGPWYPIEWIHCNFALGVQAVVATAPFAQTSWPPPRRVAFSPQSPVQQSNIGLLMPTSAPFSQTNWPAPLVRPYVSIEWIHCNFALGVQFPAPTLPKNQYDWPVPRAPQYPTSLRGYSYYNFPLYFVAPVATPFVPQFWPLPPKPQASAPQPVAQRSTALLGTPFAQEDWPLPRRVPYVVPPLVQQTSQLLLTPQVQPFTQEDWPLPRRLQYVVPPFVQQVNQALLTPAAQVQPFAQLEWQLPKRPAAPIPASFIQQNLSLFYAQTQPFAQLEWPTPKRVVPSVPANFVQQNLGVFYGQTQPFMQEDWPLPRRVPFAPQPIVQQASIALLGTLVAVTPFAQSSWPAPIQRPYVSIEWIHSNHVLGAPVVVTVLPFAQFDWPVPKAPQYPIGLRTWVQPYNLGVYSVTPVVPLRPSVPVAPIRRVTTIQSLVAQSEIVLSGQVRPFSQQSWALPPPAKRLVQHVFQRNLLLYRQDLLPFAQYDWPLPRIPQYPTSRYGWIDVSKPSLRVFVAPTPFAQYSWPPPRVPLYPYSLYGYEYGIEPLPGRTARPPPPPPEPSSLPTSGYESQVGVWHGGNVRHGRTGKRYRVYR